MNNIASNLRSIIEKINQAIIYADDPQRHEVNLVAVSKTVGSEKIEQAIKVGCNVFGENRVNEAKEKWPLLRTKYPHLKLHLIGHLQSNKVKEAVQLFDVIESVDSEKLVEVLLSETQRQNKKTEFFVQINIGEEPQKSGILPINADSFIQNSIAKGLNITGVMCIPPHNEDPALYFALLRTIAMRNNLVNISMGMSEDFALAIIMGANYIRIGRGIFGEREEKIFPSATAN